MMTFFHTRIARLRAQTEHYRDLACGAVPLAVAAELERLGDEYEGRAEQMKRLLTMPWSLVAESRASMAQPNVIMGMLQPRLDGEQTYVW